MNDLYSVGLLLLGILLFVYLGHIIARKKGLNPVFWGMMGGAFGPFMLPFLLLAKPGKKNQDDSAK